MGYIDSTNQLFKEVSISSMYYVKVHELLSAIYRGSYQGDSKVVSDMDQLLSIRSKKINAGRSTKSVLSATDSQVYVMHAIWKRLARNEPLTSTIEQAYFLLDHFKVRADRKEPKFAKDEYETIGLIRQAIETESFDFELLGMSKVNALLGDINPYKNLESYLKDPSSLESKVKARWREELPLLMVVLGIDPEIFRAHLKEESVNPHNCSCFLKIIANISNRFKVFVLTAITVGSVYFLSLNENPVEANELPREEAKRINNVVEKSLKASELFSAFSPISASILGADSLIIKVNQIEALKVIDGEEEVPLKEITLRILIQNASEIRGYVFEGIQVTALQNFRATGQLRSKELLRNNARLAEIHIPCDHEELIYRTIINNTGNVLKPNQETICFLKMVLSPDCNNSSLGYQVVPFKLTFIVQDLKSTNPKNMLVELEETIKIAF